MKRNIIVITILILGLFLKFHNYDIYPQRGATSDEYTYSFLGVSLLTKGIPISWSHFSEYKNRQDLIIDDIYFPIVWPYFDHPPLNGLVVGLWSILFRGDSFEKIQLSVIRIVPILLSTISSILVYLIAKQHFGFNVGYISLLIYSTVTIFVIQSRVVLAENLLTPLFLSAVFLYNRWKKHFDISYILLIGLLSGLSFWTKEIGVVVFIVLFFMMIYDKIHVSFIASFVLTSLLFFLGYIAYGMYFDGEVFWKIVAMQSTRDVGPKTLLYLLFTPIIINKSYLDGWYFLGFISLFITFVHQKYLKVIAIPAFTYFFLLLLLLTQEGEMGWYLIPLFPFMAMAIGVFLIEGIKERNWYIFLLLLFVGFSQIQQIYETSFGLVPIQFRLLSLVLFVPCLVAWVLKKQGMFYNMSKFYFYCLIAGNIYLTYNYIHPA